MIINICRKSMWAFAFILLLGAAARATTSIFYFGGYGSTQAMVDSWARSAVSSPPDADLQIRGIPYPCGASSAKASALKYGSTDINEVVAEIDSLPAQHFLIVGHSSGSALANHVAELVKNPSQVELIVLDGFIPTNVLQKRVATTCFYAKNVADGIRSPNASSMESCLKNQAYSAPWCDTSWCLHFSLVNVAVSATLNAGNFESKGYENCASNLFWLPAEDAIGD